MGCANLLTYAITSNAVFWIISMLLPCENWRR